MLRINRIFVILLRIIYVVVVILHILVVRPAYLEWVATAPKLNMLLPSDAEVPDTVKTSTRGIIINVPTIEVWRWLVQIGQDRGGWYSFHWLENLFAANMNNTDHIVDEWQTLQIGDRLPFLEGGENDTFTAEVTAIDPELALVLEDPLSHSD